MQNAHLRMGRLEYRRNSGSTNTRISVHVDRYVGEGDDAHLISLFGNDAEVGAITAAIYEKHTFTVTFADAKEKVVGFGPDAICYRGSINLQGQQTSPSASGRGFDLASCQRKCRTDVHPAPRAGYQRTRMGNPGELSMDRCRGAADSIQPLNFLPRPHRLQDRTVPARIRG
jgi:hypothetical protein